MQVTNATSQRQERNVLTADVFESGRKNLIEELWEKANDIEITLDFLKFFKFFG